MVMTDEGILAVLDAKATDLENQAREIRNCIRVLSEHQRPAASKPATTKKTGTHAAKAAKGKTKKVRKATKAAPTDDTARSVKGRKPTKGVVQTYCATLKERSNELARLRGLGYTRVGLNQPLTAGTYDVRASGDPDDSSFVLYREIESEGASA